MTITASSLGLTTTHLEITGLTNTFSEFKTAFKNAVLGTATTEAKATGWLLHDEVTAGIQYTLVFKAPNKDGVTYKNIILRFDTIRCEINSTTCESWDNTTHTATNEAWTFNDCAPIPYRLSGCDIVINAAPRWFTMLSYLANEPSCWAGVFEMERINAKDIADKTLPCWGWMSSTLQMLGASLISATPIATGQQPLICMPRTANGSTRINAAIGWGCDFGVTISPSKDLLNASGFMHQIGSAYPSRYSVDGFDDTKKPLLPMKPIHRYQDYKNYPYGKIFGLSAVNSVVDSIDLNKVSIPVDSDGNFSVDGAMRDAFLLNNHWKSDDASEASWFGNTAHQTVSAVIGETAKFIQTIGEKHYVLTTSNKLLVVDAYFLTSTLLSTVGALRDCKFDGERYIYVSSATGIYRIDTIDNSISFLAVASLGSIAINQTHIIVSIFASTATPTIYRILKSTFALDTTNGTLVLASFTGSVFLSDAVTDNAGNVYFVPSTTVAANFKLTKIAPDGTVSYLSTNMVTNVAPAAGLQILSNNRLVVWVATTNSNMYGYLINTDTFAYLNTSQGGTFGAINRSIDMSDRIQSTKIDGVLFSFIANSSASSSARSKIGVSSVTSISAPIVDITNPEFVPTGGIMWDGTKLYTAASGTTMKIWSRFHGTMVQDGVTLGQMVLPA